MKNIAILSSAVAFVLVSLNTNHAAAASAVPVDGASSLSGDTARRPMTTAAIRQIAPHFYCAQRASDTDLTFGMVRLREETLPLWLDFVCGQYSACAQAWFSLCPREKPVEKDEEDKLRKFFDLINITKLVDKTRSDSENGIGAGLNAFTESLSIFKAYNYQPELWIAYALSGEKIPLDQPITKELFPHIEMVLTVLTSRKAPFTVHMGIARTVYHEVAVFKGELRNHAHLSIALHGFAAKVIQKEHPLKFWMITSPVEKMAKIFRLALTGNIMPAEALFQTLSPALENMKQAPDEWKWFCAHHYLLIEGGMPSYAVSLEALAEKFA